MEGYHGGKYRERIVRTRLNPGQILAHDMVIRSCTHNFRENLDGIGDEEPVNLMQTGNVGRLQIIVGQGGCGKSFTVNAIITSLKEEYNWTEDNFCIYATNGKAATNINGSTLQNFVDGLGLFVVGGNFKKLAGETLIRMQDRMKNVRLIIIDKFSMLRQCELYYIDERLRQIMGTPDESFGGITIVLTGDPAQLAPVKGNCLWDPRAQAGSHDLYSLVLYYALFQTVICLDKNMRLDSVDPDVAIFATFLLRLRDGLCTEADWEMVKTQCSNNSMSMAEWAKHIGIGATHIFCTNREVGEHNAKCIKDLGVPIVCIEAEYTGRGHAVSTANAGGLESRTYLAVGARVLLTKSTWQQAGLCNGAVGIVVDIVYDQESPPPKLPLTVIVDFGESYTGRAFFEEDDHRGWVPIFPEEHEWRSEGDGIDVVEHSRKNVPLRLSFTWTMWKVQGQTFTSKIVLHLGLKEADHGITYTGFSRVTHFSDIGIAGGFPRARLCEKVAEQAKMERRIKADLKRSGEALLIVVQMGARRRCRSVLARWGSWL